MPTSSNHNSRDAGDTSSATAAIVCFDPTRPDEACPICEGIGLIRYEVELNDPRFGRLFRCPNNPIAEDKQHLDRLMRASNLTAFSDKTFENFDTHPAGYLPDEIRTLELAWSHAQRFAQAEAGWLLLEGGYGCGKTHLAAAIGHTRLAQGDSVLFLTAPDLLDHLRRAYSPTAEASYDDTFERIKTVGLLILDDLGVENPSPWAQEKLFQLLNHRYSHRQTTIITTNTNLDDLDPRIRSRLLDDQMIARVSIAAPDYRSMTKNPHDELLSRLNLYQDMTFETFDMDTGLSEDERQNMHRATRAAADFAQTPRGWLLFTGDFGTGKTHLAAAIANYRQQSHHETVVFLTAPDLLDYLRTTFEPSSHVTFDELFDRIRNVPLLVLDDLGAEGSKTWAQEKLFQLLDYRYVARRPTVITTSRPMDDLNKRLITRLLDQRICRIIAITATTSYAIRLKNR